MGWVSGGRRGPVVVGGVVVTGAAVADAVIDGAADDGVSTAVDGVGVESGPADGVATPVDVVPVVVGSPEVLGVGLSSVGSADDVGVVAGASVGVVVAGRCT